MAISRRRNDSGLEVLTETKRLKGRPENQFLGDRKMGLPSNIPVYDGSLDVKKMCPAVKKAWWSYGQQRQRCHNSKQKFFYNYGGKGVKVLYSAREFISWWLYHLNTFTGKVPTVGRLDHNGNYEFGNIEMQSLKENSKEVRSRLGPVTERVPIVCYDYKSGEPLMVFESVWQAAKFTDTKHGNILSVIKGNHKQAKGYTFKRLKDTKYTLDQ